MFKPFQPSNLRLIRPLADNRCAPFKSFGIQEIDLDFLNRIPTRCLVRDEQYL